jgi:hypothetical protein
MKDNILFVIYRVSEIESESSYLIDYCYNEKEMYTTSQLSKSFEETQGVPPMQNVPFLGPFKTFDVLKTFALHFIKEQNILQAFLVENLELNEYIKDISSPIELEEKMIEHSKKIENENAKNSGLFGRFF